MSLATRSKIRFAGICMCVCVCVKAIACKLFSITNSTSSSKCLHPIFSIKNQLPREWEQLMVFIFWFLIGTKNGKTLVRNQRPTKQSIKPKCIEFRLYFVWFEVWSEKIVIVKLYCCVKKNLKAIIFRFDWNE